MQGPSSESSGEALKTLGTALAVGLCFIILVGGVEATAGFPDVGTCDDTLVVNFPTTLTISKSYLFVVRCPTEDVNQGDFVSAWTEDTSGAPVEVLSEYENTDQGVEWTAPLSDSNGNAWGHLNVSPAVYDCNSTGVPYTLEFSWDKTKTTHEFKVYCPVLSMKRYRETLPLGEGLSFTVEVRDDQGYLMRGVECSAMLLYDSADDNITQIRQRRTEVFTNKHGVAEFDFEPGLLQGFLVNYEYSSMIECLGSDVNFGFTVGQVESQYLRNPLYYGLLFISENALVLLLVMVSVGFFIGMIILMVRERT